MGFVKRAATGILSLIIVSALLVAGHWVAGAKHRLPRPSTHAAIPAMAVPPGPIPDCKMPSCPPASGPLVNLANPDERSLVRHVDAGEAAFDAPLPLPARTNAIPLHPEGPEFPATNESPASAPASPGSSAIGRRIIDRSLPNSNAEEREVWHDTLKDLSPKDVRELMRLRDELGRIPQSVLENREPSVTLRPLPIPGPISGGLIDLPTDGPAAISGPTGEASRTITSSLETLAQAQQLVLNNVANASTDGFKRVVIALEGSSTFSVSRHAQIGAGVRMGSPILDLSQGKIRRTDRPLDLAIDGEGFFELEDRRTKQNYYTRCGRFALNAKGEFVWRTTTRELHLVPSVTITEFENGVEISTNGTLRLPGDEGTTSGSTRQNQIQKIQLVRLPSTANLMATGDNLFVVRADLAPSAPTAEAVVVRDARSSRLRQGCLEESNVDLERELKQLESLRRHGHALEMAAQSFPLGPQESLIAPSVVPAVPSHIAGALGQERR
jgi:flagellar basal body rod protein FlgG